MAAPRAQATPAHTDPRGPDFDAIPSPMAVLDQDLTIVSANRALADLLQAHEASLVGETLGHRLRSAASDTPTGDGIQTFGFQHPDGPRWLRLDLQPYGDGFLVILADVSGERAVLERMKADLAARGRLMHD